MHHLSKSAVCPFYQNAEGFKVKCEGFNEGTRICLCFADKNRMNRHTKIYCRNINGYYNCPLYPVIYKQYEEDKKP